LPNLEKRVQALEQEHSELRRTIELQTIAIGALVNKSMLEKLNEKHNKIFEALITHDRLTNEQLAELRAQQVEEDGKIVGLQTEMRQRFTDLDGKIVGQQTEMRQHFAEQDSKIAGLQTEVRQRFAEQDRKTTELQTTQTALLQQILTRLPEK